jgi:hypothetical protein
LTLNQILEKCGPGGRSVGCLSSIDDDFVKFTNKIQNTLYTTTWGGGLLTVPPLPPISRRVTQLGNRTPAPHARRNPASHLGVAPQHHTPAPHPSIASAPRTRNRTRTPRTPASHPQSRTRASHSSVAPQRRTPASHPSVALPSDSVALQRRTLASHSSITPQ